MELSAYLKENEGELLKIFKDLCHIPAPSYHEEKRAAYCRDFLLAAGAEGVYIDEAKNVVFPLCCEGSDAITVLVAHTDTVFPDTEPMPYLDDGEKIHCPGAGDDTACLAVMLMTAKYYVEHDLRPVGGLLFVANSCEEGLGNLAGTRQIFKDYAGRIKRFISLDSYLGIINDRCVGSRRYRVTVQTAGGHSYLAFGAKNAITELSRIAVAIYDIRLPEKPDAKTTYNVGTITGGTSVNTIAQSAEMLCEYRSDDAECLAAMDAEFSRIFREANTGDVQVTVEKIGDRPSACGVDEREVARLAALAAATIRDVTGIDPIFKSSSTDCNIPLSLGIPAVCIGTHEGFGMHMREEWIKKDSLIKGYEVVLRYLDALLK